MEIINRVANSSLITINLEHMYPEQEFSVFDIKDYLFKGLILKEKDFRSALKTLDWSSYQNKIVLIVCTADAIIPLWSYMLVSTYLNGIAHEVYTGNKDAYLSAYYTKMINEMDLTQYDGGKIVIKGCSNQPVPSQAYAMITHRLSGIAQSIMFGEPCSTVPIYKRPKAK